MLTENRIVPILGKPPADCLLGHAYGGSYLLLTVAVEPHVPCLLLLPTLLLR
jgi:hypothetical protein